MVKKVNWLSAMLLILPMVVALGCTEKFGKVDQGRVIGYDKETHSVTFLRDVSVDTAKGPEYNLPPVTYALPSDPMEVGPEPKVGKRIKLDAKTKQIIVYVPTRSRIVAMSFCEPRS